MSDAHTREMLDAMSDVELDALEKELLERLAMREDRRVFSAEREDKVFTWVFGVLGLIFAVCIYQLIQLWFLHLTSADAELNMWLVYLVCGIGGFGFSFSLRIKYETVLSRWALYLVRRREYLIYVALFALSIVGNRANERLKAEALEKSKLPWSGPTWAILALEEKSGLMSAARYKRDEAEAECVKAGWKLATRGELLKLMAELKPHLEGQEMWVSDVTEFGDKYVSSVLYERKPRYQDPSKWLPLTNRDRSAHTQLAAVCTLKTP